MSLLVVSKVKKLAAENGKRCGSDFLAALDKHVYDLVVKASKVHDGQKKTMGAMVAKLAGI